MIQETTAVTRLSRKDALYLVGLVGSFSCAMIFQYVWVNEGIVRAANIVLFAILGVYFLQRAYYERANQMTISTVVLIVGGLAWITFAVLIALGQASGF